MRPGLTARTTSHPAATGTMTARGAHSLTEVCTPARAAGPRVAPWPEAVEWRQLRPPLRFSAAQDGAAP